MMIKATFISPDSHTWSEMYTNFRSIPEAKADLSQPYKGGRKLVRLEPVYGKAHDWEHLGGHSYQCKQCGVMGRPYQGSVRPAKKVHPSVPLHCRPERLLDNIPESAKWAAQIRKSGFR